MTPSTPDQPLTDGEITLHLVRDAPADPAKNWVRALHYEIVVASCGHVAGNIDLRLGLTPALRLFGGNIGYGVHPEWRGRHFAEKACRLLIPVALAHGLTELWITCDPDNTPSRRTCERLGATLIDIIDLPPNNDEYHEGSRQKCRFHWKPRFQPPKRPTDLAHPLNP